MHGSFRPRRTARTPGQRALDAAPLTLAITLSGLQPASAAAPAPAQPVSREVYSGRWYEIARTSNRVQKGCEYPTTDFQTRGPDASSFILVEACHRTPDGAPSKTTTARGRIVSARENSRFRVSFLGGLIRQEYWILDHAPDNAWLLMGTPGGHFVWLLSRRPVMPPSALTAALTRAGRLGYPRSSLVYADQSGG